MRLKDQLLALAVAYGAAVGKSQARVSTMIWGGGDRFKRLRAGHDMHSMRVEDAIQWFSDRWPEGTTWPSDVPRPAPSPPAPVPPSPASDPPAPAD